jgi:hypothetical protein
MAHFVGLDVSVKETAVCVVDDAGKVVSEQKVATEPDEIVALLTSIGGDYPPIADDQTPNWCDVGRRPIAAAMPRCAILRRHRVAHACEAFADRTAHEISTDLRRQTIQARAVEGDRIGIALAVRIVR